MHPPSRMPTHLYINNSCNPELPRTTTTTIIKVVSLTVRLLVSGTRTWTTKLLRLAPSVVGNKESAVVLDKSLLELVLCVLVDVLLVVGDNGLGDCLTDSINLRSVTTTSDANTDIDVG